MYEYVCCHICGYQVCSSCGCCCNPTCEACSCPEVEKEDEEHI